MQRSARHTPPGILLTTFACAALVSVPAAAELRFRESFEGDLSGWDLTGESSIFVRDSGDPEHGRVLVLEPGETVRAMIRGSEKWGAVAIECDFLFPSDASSYLGVVYHFTESGTGRTDFGSLYIKGDGSYLRANPWRDGNVSRLLYEEFKTPLLGDDAVRIGSWSRLRAEIVGRDVHLFVGDPNRPKMTFDLYEGDSGQVGFNPRVTGWPVWIDNVEVRSIDGATYGGPPIPAIEYDREALLTEWHVAGPKKRPDAELEDNHRARLEHDAADRVPPGWRDLETDRRGAVVTGRITEYAGQRPVAYFRTLVEADAAGEAILHFSTTDELALWVNGEFLGFIYRNGYRFGTRDWNAWHDFWKNPEHSGSRVPIRLTPGLNEVLVRVRNGQFASGGFFARLEPPGDP